MARRAGRQGRPRARCFESQAGLFDPALDAGAIALACALGYLDLRFAGTWRSDHPKLVAWLAAFEEKVPAFGLTRAA